MTLSALTIGWNAIIALSVSKLVIHAGTVNDREFLLEFGHSVNSAAVSTAFAIKLKRSGSSAEVPLGSTSVVSEVHCILTEWAGQTWLVETKIWWWTDFWWRNKFYGGTKNKKSSRKEAIQCNSYGICINFHIWNFGKRINIKGIGSQNF